MTTTIESASINIEKSISDNHDSVDHINESIESKLVLDDDDRTTIQTKDGSEITTTSNLNKDTTISNSNPDVTAGLDVKQKKKLDKLAESILKRNSSTNGTTGGVASGQQLNTLEDKFYAMVKSYLDLQEQNKKLQLNNKEIEKSINNYIKQRDLMQNDCNKSLLAKNKLESLCRELQKHNKIIKEENLQRISKEEEKRKEITVKFQSAIEEINQQVASNTEKNNALIQENVQLTTKLKSLLEQYEMREQHVEKILKHKDLEIQLANAKLQQSELKLTEVNERTKSEKAIYENHCVELTKKCEFHQEAEKQLKNQLSMYTEKYEEFQVTLKKSNQVFESFKTEMDKMNKKIKKLEQETVSWKNKWEGCDKSLQNVLKQKEELEEKFKKSNVRADTMEKLSRTLQAERNTLKEQLKQFIVPNEVEVKKNEDTTPSLDTKEIEVSNINSEVKEVTNNASQNEDAISNESTSASTTDASNHIDETAKSN